VDARKMSLNIDMQKGFSQEALEHIEAMARIM
jgi:hypothetical protein